MNTYTLEEHADHEFTVVHRGDTIEVIGKCLTVSDGYHTMDDLYDHRLALTVALFNTWYKYGVGDEVQVMKSKLHDDGTMFNNYFIVVAATPRGNISYHYKLEHWDKFKIPEVERAPEWDGHDSKAVCARLMSL